MHWSSTNIGKWDMEREKRRFTRVRFNVAARLIVNGVQHEVEELVNLSVGGCLVTVPIQPEVGSDCLLVICLARMAPGVEVYGKIVRVNGREASVQFTRIDPENLLHLQNIVRYNATDPDVIENELSIRKGIK